MKRPFYIIILCLICSVSYAQNSAKAKKFINEVITDKNINYQDSIDRWARAFMHEGLKNTRVVYNFREDSVDYENNTGLKRHIVKPTGVPFYVKYPPIKGRITEIVADSLVLTDAEIAYANSEIDKMSNYKWKSDLLPNSKLLSADSLSALQKRWDNLRNKPLTGLSKEEREKWLRSLIEKSKKEFIAFHKLSVPIFLRNDTYCLFYHGEDCINTIDWGCGSGNFMVYKKVNGKWVYWGRIFSWIV